LDRIIRRLMQYAGLGHLDIALWTYSEMPDLPGDPCARIVRSVAMFGGIKEIVCLFGCCQDISLDFKYMAGVMAHEVAHAFREYHHLVRSGSRFEEELLTDLTAVYLGFGILSLNISFQVNSTGMSKSGYLPAQALSFLITLQMAARGINGSDRRRLLRLLDAAQVSYCMAAEKWISEREFPVSERLRLPRRDQWKPEPPLDSLLLPLPVVPELAKSSLASEPEQHVNAGQPVYRVAQSKTRHHAFSAIGLWILVIIFGGSELRPLYFLGSAVLLIGAGLCWRRTTYYDECSASNCQRIIPPGTGQCPYCGGQIKGVIRHRDDRLGPE